MMLEFLFLFHLMDIDLVLFAHVSLNRFKHRSETIIYFDLFRANKRKVAQLIWHYARKRKKK